MQSLVQTYIISRL